MFVGHAAVALAAKVATPRASLGTFVAAAYALDLLWPIFLLLGIEHVRIDPGNTAFTPLAFDSYPWSHSLLMSVVWGALAVAIVRTRRATRQVQWLVFLLVISHWVLDVVTHRADLPLWPSTATSAPSLLFGMGLWNSIAATYVVEGGIFAVAIVLYLRATSAADRTGSIAFWLFVTLLTVIWASQPFSPPPPSERAIAWVGITGGLFPLWAWWFDRHRRPRTTS